MEKISITDEKVVINGKTYIPEETSSSHKNHDSDVRIVVLQRGWIHIGRYVPVPQTKEVELHNSYNIHNWGTTKGLGELCSGPTNKTVLNKNEGIVRFLREQEVFNMSVEKSKYPMI